MTKALEFEVKGTKHQLVRVRNPWGNEVEWNGAWSDNSKEWGELSKEQQATIGLVKEEDGEWFMTYEDFRKVCNHALSYAIAENLIDIPILFSKHFDGLDICHVSMDSLDPNGLGWHKAEIDGSWIKGVSNGGFKSIQDNP